MRFDLADAEGDAADTELDQVFTDFATIPTAPLSLDPADIAENRADWIDRWTEIVS